MEANSLFRAATFLVGQTMTGRVKVFQPGNLFSECLQDELINGNPFAIREFFGLCANRARKPQRKRLSLLV